MSGPSPYVSVADLLAAPLPISWQGIGPQQSGGPTVAQNAEQLNELCIRATEMVEGDCGQPLRATLDTETVLGPSHRVGVMQNGWGRVLTSMFPVSKVVQVRCAYGPPTGSPATFSFTAVPQGMAFPVQQPFHVTGSAGPRGATAGQNAIYVTGGYVNRCNGTNGIWIEATYINGWPHTALTAAASAGSSTLSLNDVTGWFNSLLYGGLGVTGRIYDGANTEVVTVASVTPNVTPPTTPPYFSEPVGPGTVTLTTPLAFAHDAGPLLSSLPSSVRDATMLFAAAQALRRGVGSLSVPTLPGSSGGGPEAAIEFLEHSAVLDLAPYRRVY